MFVMFAASSSILAFRVSTSLKLFLGWFELLVGEVLQHVSSFHLLHMIAGLLAVIIGVQAPH
jgi:hypothetical protein